MLFRFSLYGFLKNQRYFEPFLILAFLEKGLSFFQIGILVAFREVWLNLTEIPSGAIADVFGRRKCMMLSFASYVAAFANFAIADVYWQLFPAMLLLAVGDAFRTGTHKAMIFTWLRLNNRTSEKTKVYGYTRSWSKLGSAVSVVLATAYLLIADGGYDAVFVLSIIPYALGFVNFLGYPKELDGEHSGNADVKQVVRMLWDAARQTLRTPQLRRLVTESMSFEGTFKTAKDYLQPLVAAMAVGLPLAFLDDDKRSVLLVGITYLLLYLGSALVSRRAHQFVDRLGSEERAAGVTWRLNLLVYATLLPLLYCELFALAIAGFVLLHLLQNLWRPILVSRIDEHAPEEQSATILSIESQAKSLVAMVLAPLVGLAVDHLKTAQHTGDYAGGVFWPIAAVGAAITLAIMLAYRPSAATGTD